MCNAGLVCAGPGGGGDGGGSGGGGGGGGQEKNSLVNVRLILGGTSGRF